MTCRLVDWRVSNEQSSRSEDHSRLRVAAINFLNPAPLMWDFDHDPLREELAGRYEVREMPPSQCAEQLATGEADIGLVPIAAYATVPDLLILPGCTVASKGSIRSLLLVYRDFGGVEAIRTVAADTSSRATFAYVQILFRKYWKVPVTFAPYPPNLDAMLMVCDAAILIGDPALIALEDRAAREQRTGESLVYLDLGEAWRKATGLAWVSAFWAVRKDAAGSERNRRQISQDFTDSRDHGLLHREDLVKEWTPRLAIPPDVIRTYLTKNIHYVLDDECLAGMQAFFRLAEECGVLPPAPAIRLL